MHRSLAVLAGMALAVVAAAVPAQAAPAAGFDLKLKEVTLAPGGSQGDVGILTSARPATVTGASASMEITGDIGNVLLAGNLTPGPCDQTLLKTLGCQIDDLALPAGPKGASFVAGGIVAGPDVVPGATGTLTVTFKADGIAPITRSVRIRVGAPVDLTAGPTADLSAAPGSAFALPLTVSNSGTSTVDGAAMLFTAQDAYESTSNFKNCRYDGGRLTACSFDQTLEPGASYRIVLPERLRHDTYAPDSRYATASWRTAAEFADLDAFLTSGSYKGLGKPGSGAVLSLVRVATAKAQAVQSDPNVGDNSTTITVKTLGKNGLNLVAVGARLTGKAGSTVIAKVGVRNAGPAALDMTNQYHTVLLAVDIPAGSDAASIPRDCAPKINGRLDIQISGGTLGYREYWCQTNQKLAVGQTQIFPIGLRITKVIASATGAIEINKKDSGWDPYYFTDRPKTDNKSAIVLNAPGKPSGGGSGGNGGSDDGNGSGDNGDGGGLPITGPRSLAIGGSGLLVLLAGAGAVLLVRRRRTRFEV